MTARVTGWSRRWRPSAVAWRRRPSPWPRGPATRIPAEQMPTDVATARAMLVQARPWAPPGTLTKRDINYVLRLSSKYLAARGRRPPARRRWSGRLVNAWWYTLRAGPIKRSIIRDPDGVLSTYWGRAAASRRTRWRRRGRWQGLNESLAPEVLAEALLPYGVERRWTAASTFDLGVLRRAGPAGAHQAGASGMAQGRIAQLMARAYKRTGDRRSGRGKARSSRSACPSTAAAWSTRSTRPGYPQRPGTRSGPTPGRTRGAGRR